jgi:hypothetical protein
MVESGGDDDSIIFNKENIHPKIITIAKERVINEKQSENVLILNKGRNKIQMNIESKNKKINKEEIIKSLNNLKKIEIENLDNNYYNYKTHKNKNDISPYNLNRTSLNNLSLLVQKEKEKNNEANKDFNNIVVNRHINHINQNIYDKSLNPVKINCMKNILLKKEKEQKDKIDEENKKSSFNLYDKYLFSKGDNDYIDINRQSDRYSLKCSSSNDYNNLGSNSDRNYNNHYKSNNINYNEDIKQENNRGLENKIDFHINKKEISRNLTLNIDRRNSTHLITSIVNMLHTTKSHFSENTLNSSNYDKCLMCERSFSIINLCCSECNIHFFCRRCLKNYCREKIEKGIKRMKCPITKCNYNIYEEFLKSILSEDYYHLLYKRSKSIKSDDKTIESENISKNKYEIFNKKLKHNSIDKHKRIKLYNNRHVIDINSNIMLYNMKKYKDEYCSKCGEPALFCKTSTFFHKCLNCGFKICKYCNKEYTKTHLILNCENHCTVYFRKIGKNNLQNNYFYDYSMQLVYVIAMFYITFAFCFLSIFRFLNKILDVQKNKENLCISFIYHLKNLFCIFISIVLFIIIFPILFIWTPYFPSIIALFDGY